jgi:hypothetical protein
MSSDVARQCSLVRVVDLCFAVLYGQNQAAIGQPCVGLAMAFKLIESAQRRWRMVNAPRLVALVRAEAKFVNGKLVDRPASQSPEAADPSPAAADNTLAEAA